MWFCNLEMFMSIDELYRNLQIKVSALLNFTEQNFPLFKSYCWSLYWNKKYILVNQFYNPFCKECVQLNCCENLITCEIEIGGHIYDPWIINAIICFLLKTRA